MTISYTADVANASNFGVFTRILLRWKGSVYKLVYKELLAFLSVYFLLNIVYRNLLMTPGWEFYRYLRKSLCGNFMIFLSIRFYMKSIFVIFWASNFVNLVKFKTVQKLQKCIEIKIQSL